MRCHHCGQALVGLRADHVEICVFLLATRGGIDAARAYEAQQRGRFDVSQTATPLQGGRADLARPPRQVTLVWSAASSA
jgi:hypothetical protein